MTHLDFLKQEFGGPNWVLARRSNAVVRSYGEDVVCVSRQRYQNAERKWRALYGDPYDKTRADLYTALKSAAEHITRLCPTNPIDPWGAVTLGLLERINAALEAERNAP